MRMTSSEESDQWKQTGAKDAIHIRQGLQRLFKAAAAGDLESIDACLAEDREQHAGLQPSEILSHTKDANGRTALHFAAHAGRTKAVRYLLDLAPDGVRWLDEAGNTPLTLAVGAGADRGELVKLLLERGSTPDEGAEGRPRALHHVAAQNDVGVLTQLLAAGADVEVQTECGRPVHWAAGGGAANTLQALIEAGVDVNAANEQCLTPIILAVAEGNAQSVMALIEAGADVSSSVEGVGSLTALHMIAESGDHKAVQAALKTEQGKSASLLESGNGKPIHLAARGGHSSIVKLLHPHSQVKESVDELMDWGRSKAREDKEQQKATDVPEHTHTDFVLPAPTEEIVSPEVIAQASNIKDEANRAFIAKEYERALLLYNKAIALHGREATFWSNRSGCLMKLARAEEALHDAEMARALKPTWPKACYRMAEARLALQHYEDAAVAAYEGIQLGGMDPAMHKLMQQAIVLGREEYQARQATDSTASPHQ